MLAGAVLTNGDEIIAQSGDQSIQLNDPVALAEMNDIRRAADACVMSHKTEGRSNA